jgi:peptidyl-prolyl cis-trans isomerase SurA
MTRAFKANYKMALAAALSVAAITAWPLGTQAQPAASPAAAVSPLSEGVAAIVNDSIISTYDLRQRIMLLIVTAGVQPTEENMPQIQREALRALVDEHLEIQELRRVEKQQKFTIIADDQDIDRQISRMAEENRMTGPQLLQSLQAAGVGPATLKDQLRAEISWQRWINGRYGSRLRVGEDQIEAQLAQINAAAAKPQFLMSEIFIDPARTGGLDNAVRGGQQLIAQLQQGAPFAAVARQFSSASTAATGGDAGWVSSGTLAPELQQALDEMRPGQLSQPITTKDGVYILFLREKRAGSKAALVDLKQLAIRVAKDASPEQLEAARVKLAALKPSISSCGDMESVAAKADGVLAGDLGEAEIKDLAPAFREAAEVLNVGQVSDPIRTPAGLHLIAVCGKRQGGAKAPTKEEIENRMIGQQLAMISKRYLRDLRNSATIETR